MTRAIIQLLAASNRKPIHFDGLAEENLIGVNSDGWPESVIPAISEVLAKLKGVKRDHAYGALFADVLSENWNVSRGLTDDDFIAWNTCYVYTVELTPRPVIRAYDTPGSAWLTVDNFVELLAVSTEVTGPDYEARP